MKNYTTSEQAASLIKLGLPINSADCIRVTRTDMVFFIPEEKTAADYIETYNTERNEKAEPCWSVGRLIELHEILFPQYKNFIIERDDITLISRMVKYYEIGAKQGVLDFSKLED